MANPPNKGKEQKPAPAVKPAAKPMTEKPAGAPPAGKPGTDRPGGKK